MLNSEAAQQVLDYIIESEMGGKLDEKDSWFSTYELVSELKEKMLEEEEV